MKPLAPKEKSHNPGWSWEMQIDAAAETPWKSKKTKLGIHISKL
jgi:hypothetical protein